MDDNSTKAATEKADNIYVKVGYPKSPDTLDAQSIAWYYRPVAIQNNTYFENLLSSR
jgi:endothelin-converting enzyme